MTLREWWDKQDFWSVAMLLWLMLAVCFIGVQLFHIYSITTQQRKLDDLRIKERELDILERQVQIEKIK